MDNDTDTLLALLASLLEYTLPQDALLDALIHAKGDVLQAAAALSRDPPRGQKRRRNLDDWFKSLTKKVPENENACNTTPRLRSRRTSPLSQRRVKSITDVLRAPIPEPRTDPHTIQLPPLTLADAGMVASHTPCTLHKSVLPPELACELYYSLLDKSSEWSRNKWWLFDRVVESPHLTTFLVRDSADITEDDRNQAAKYWYGFNISVTLN